MATIQVVIESELLEQLDSKLNGAKKARSAFVRRLIREELERMAIADLEDQHRKSYEDFPETETERIEYARLERAQDVGEPWPKDLR